MITPDKIPVDDSDDSGAEDQVSQQDIHSNGLDEQFDPNSPDSSAPIDLLQQASDASEASFTLDLGRDIAPKGGVKKKE
ncbi:hypothetical protein ACPPVU_00860 [Mucilaginibacter sp. McL0603]|uniref:hypothetical protein n=1 Tax=Mucilaginibacter sp. McL0603 TaxID=3415670 RepID=UPI003CF09047